MEPTTLRLPEGLHESLDSEAEERGFGSMSEYVRWILKHRGYIPDTERSRSEYADDGSGIRIDYDRIRSMLEDHEERITALEEGQATGQMAELVDQVDWSEVNVARTDPRKQALSAALEMIEAKGSAIPSEIREEVHEVLEAQDDSLSDSSVQRLISDALGQVDAISIDAGGKRYRWTRSSSSSV